MTEMLERYPMTREMDGGTVHVTVMSGEHREQALELAASLPAHDLLFLRRDIAHPKVMDAWIRGIEEGSIYSLIATEDSGDGAKFIGCSAVVLDPHSFSGHVADLRVVLAPEVRAKGVGRLLIQENFLLALALDLRKLTVQMTADQDAAMNVFMDMGFLQEALLRDQVMDARGVTHDLVILGHDVERVRAKRELYGIAEAFEGAE